MALILSTAEFLAAYGPLAKQLADGDLTQEEFEEAAAPIFDGYLKGDARVARFVALVVATDTFENRLSALVADWYSGTATGGPNGDGYYPLPNADGNDYLVPSPMKVISDIAKGDRGRDARFERTFSAGFPFTISEEWGDWQATADQTFDISNSLAYARRPSTGSVVLTAYKNGSVWGTVTFSAGVNAGVFGGFADPSVERGDVVYWKAPASPDPTLANVSITLAGEP